MVGLVLKDVTAESVEFYNRFSMEQDKIKDDRFFEIFGTSNILLNFIRTLEEYFTQANKDAHLMLLGFSLGFRQGKYEKLCANAAQEIIDRYIHTPEDGWDSEVRQCLVDAVVEMARESLKASKISYQRAHGGIEASSAAKDFRVSIKDEYIEYGLLAHTKGDFRAVNFKLVAHKSLARD